MERNEVCKRLEAALVKLAENDLYLLENDLSERCIASRLAMYLQTEFVEYCVDVEFNRDGCTPKRLEIPEECANRRNRNDEALVIPDVIIHKRGPEGPNLLVLELKKTTNPDTRGCDQIRVRALQQRFGYTFGALIECETRNGLKRGIRISEWVEQN